MKRTEFRRNAQNHARLRSNGFRTAQVATQHLLGKQARNAEDQSYRRGIAAKRLASYRDPKPQSPKFLEKLKSYPPGPDPEFLKKGSKNAWKKKKNIFRVF